VKCDNSKIEALENLKREIALLDLESSDDSSDESSNSSIDDDSSNSSIDINDLINRRFRSIENRQAALAVGVILTVEDSTVDNTIIENSGWTCDICKSKLKYNHNAYKTKHYATKKCMKVRQTMTTIDNNIINIL
jgi:hypothetical protein